MHVRHNFKVKRTVINEKLQCERNKQLNESLLNNVLPQHVTSFYLTPGRMSLGVRFTVFMHWIFLIMHVLQLFVQII